MYVLGDLEGYGPNSTGSAQDKQCLVLIHCLITHTSRYGYAEALRQHLPRGQSLNTMTAIQDTRKQDWRAQGAYS
jgi:hypothetical protein